MINLWETSSCGNVLLFQPAPHGRLPSQVEPHSRNQLTFLSRHWAESSSSTLWTVWRNCKLAWFDSLTAALSLVTLRFVSCCLNVCRGCSVLVSLDSLENSCVWRFLSVLLIYLNQTIWWAADVCFLSSAVMSPCSWQLLPCNSLCRFVFPLQMKVCASWCGCEFSSNESVWGQRAGSPSL